MITKQYEDFAKEEKHNGIYVFANDSCELCEEYKKSLGEKYDVLTKDWFVVELTLEEWQEEVRNRFPQFKIPPFTCLILDGVIKAHKSGVLFDRQVREFCKYCQAVLRRENRI